MARTIDPSKMQSVHAVTRALVVKHGYGGASIAEIAKTANVAEGYLYRFYKGKEELVNELLFNTITEITDKLERLLLNEEGGVELVVANLISSFFEIANAEPEKMKFLFVLMHDYRFSVSDAQKARIFSLCKKLKVRGLRTGEFPPGINEEIIYLSTVILPIEYINLRLKNFFDKSALTKREANAVLRVCLNSLK